MTKKFFFYALFFYTLILLYSSGIYFIVPFYITYLDILFDIIFFSFLFYAAQSRQHTEDALGYLGLLFSAIILIITFILQFCPFVTLEILFMLFDTTMDFLLVLSIVLYYFLEQNVLNFKHKLGCNLLVLSFLINMVPFIMTWPDFFFYITFYLAFDFFVDDVLIVFFDNWEKKEFKSRIGIFLLFLSLVIHLSPFILMYIMDIPYSDDDQTNIFQFVELDYTGTYVDIILFILTLVPVLLSVAYFILAERKVMASVQRRKGPNVVGIFGLLQPLIDAVKLLTKEAIIPSKSNKILFIIGPVLTLTTALISWCFIPFSTTNYYLDLEYGLLFFLGFSSISVYGLLISGWASNSKYALMGAIRTVSQFISYEISFGTLLIPVVLLSQSLNFIDIVMWQIRTIWFIIPLWPVALLFFVTILAETNRTPFDLPEAEAELVAGYNTEYASVFFVMFMFAEYSNVLLMSSIFVLLFLGGWSMFFFDLFLLPEFIFSIKISFIAFIFILIRASYPRLRFDQLMNFGWQKVLPLSLSFIFLSVGMICFVTTFSI